MKTQYATSHSNPKQGGLWAGAGVVSQGTKLLPPLASPRARSVPDVVVLGNLCGLRLIYVLTEDPYGYSD